MVKNCLQPMYRRFGLTPRTIIKEYQTQNKFKNIQHCIYSKINYTLENVKYNYVKM